MAINRPFCPLSTQERRLHLTPHLSRAVCLICSRYDMHAGQLWRRAWRDGGRQRWDTSLMTFSSGWVAVKGERSNSLPVASLSTRLNLPSKDSSRWWRNQKRKPGSRNLVESAFKHSGGRRRNLRIWSENVTSTQRVSQHQQTPADILWTHSCI